MHKHFNRQNWKKEMSKFLLNDRTTPHCSTGFSPAKLLFTCEIDKKLPTIDTENTSENHLVLISREAAAKQKMKESADFNRNAKALISNVGDLVLVKQTKENKFITVIDIIV